MKKAIGWMVLLAASAGCFALPAAAHDRDDSRDSGYMRVYGNRHERRDYRDGYHRSAYDRDWR